MVSIRKKSGLARLGAWPVLAVFLFMETAGQGSALAVTAQGGSLGTPSEAGKFSLPDWLRLLPAETAKVESVRDSQSDGPFVVLLQDAHSNPEAQRNISQVLEYLAARQTKAGGKLFVAVEGARGDLHPEYFDFFPDFTEAGDSVVESLLEKGELSGTELFAWSRYKANKAAVTDQSVLFSGVETTDLYRDNLAAYRELLNSRPLFSKLLENGESALQSKISQNLNPDLVRFYKERAKRKNGQFGLRRKDAGQGDLSVYADYLKTQSEKVLGIQLEDPIEQLRFPNFVRLLKLKRHQVDLQSSSLAEAWKKFAGQLEGLPEHSALAAAFGKLGRDYGVLERTKEAVSDHGLRELSARKLLEEFEKLERDNGFSWKANASLANALKVIVLQSEVDTAFLFEEMERLENGVLEALARSDEEKKWVHKIRDFEGLKRLLYLEMTRSDLDRIKSSRPDFRELLSEILDEEDQKSLMTTAGRALTFYRQARERDEALVMNALDFSKRVTERFSKAENARPLLVLVSGGFHAEGIQEILRDREMDFALVTPRITRTDRGQLYARVMSGENANLETYFKSRQPFSTKQEALFFREAVETAIPHWLEHGSSSDEVNDLRRLFSRHPVFSESLSVEMQENPAQTFVFTPAQGGEFQTASGSAISSSLLSADIGFSRAVDSQRRTPQRFSYHWKPSRSLSSKPADVSMPAGRSELRAIPGDLTPQEIAFAEQNIQAMYSAVERSEGPDVVVIVSAQESERRYWKERLEAMKGQVISRDTVVFSVLESYGGGVPPGNGLGSLLAYQSAREESPSQAGVSWKALMERIKRQKGRDANIAIYHTAGFGSRVWPITGSEFGSKSRISMPRYLDQNGRKVPMTLLESTLFQSSIFAKNRSGRIMVFWGDQVFIPTVPLEELQSSTDSPVEILALVGQFPYEDIVNKYGLIALESDTPGQWTAARLMQKPKTVEAARSFIAEHSKITAAAKSLGSFTVDRSFWDAMMRSYRAELNEETPSEQALHRADTDGDWWIPLTSLEFALKGSEAEVSLFQSAQDLKKYLVSKNLDRPEFTDRVLRLYLSSRKVSSQPLMRVVNTGEKSLFWDFGNIGVEEGTTEGIFRRNILILLQDSPEGKLSRQFWGVPEPFTGTVPGTNVRAENSIITASELLPGSNGVIQNSVVSGMRGIFELDVQDSFLYGLTDERGSAAEGPLALNARHAIGYQLKLSLPLNIPEGHILAGVPVLGEDVVLRTTELSDAKAVWLKAMFENPVAFGSAANLIRMAEADRSALIAGVSLSDLKYRGFFDHKGNQHAVIEGVDASRNPVIAVLHVTSLDQFTDAELNEAIFSPRAEGAVFSGKLYDKEKEVLLLTYSARSELRSVGIESIRPELESLLAAASDEASLKSGFLKLIYGKLSPEQDTALRRFYSAARLNKLPYEFTEHFEGLFSSRTQAAGKDTFRSYIESELSGTATDLNGLVLDIYGAFLKTTDFSRLSTKFFRLDHTEFTRFFDTLVEEKMFAGDKSITVKSLGVSSGEEPYTLAMMIYYALKKYYTAHEREIVSKEGESSFPLWAESWNVSIEAYDYELLNLALTGNGLFDFNYDDPVGFGEVDLYLDEPWLYTADTSTGQLEPSETWRRSPETDSGTYFIFRKLLRDHLNPGDKLRFQFSAIDLLKGWMKPVYVNLRGPADARVVSRTQANAVVATYLRGSVTLDNEDDYLIQALEGSRDSRYSSIALTSNLNIKEGERSELRRTSDADDLNNVFLKAFKKLDPETLEGMRTLRLLSSRITSPGFFPNRDARQAAKIEELPELTSDRDLQEALTVLLDDYQILTAVREVATNDEESDIRFDPEAQTLSYSPDYEVAIQSRIDEALRVFEEGSYVDVQVAMGSLLRETRLGFSSEIRKRLKLSAVREFEKWRILIEVFDAETGVRSELRSAEKAYPEAFQFTSRPVVTTLGDSARVEITFKSDDAALEKSEIFFHWGDYDLGPLDWTDHEVLSWDIQDLGGGIYKASKIIQPGKIGEFGVTAYAQNRVTGERVWQGKSRSDDAMMRIDLPPKTVLEDLRRNLKKQEAIQSIRQSLVESNPYESFVETIRRLVIDEEMRGMGKIVYDAVKDVPRFRAVISEIYGRLKEDSKIWNPVYREIALPALRALETLGIGEIVFVAPEGPHAIAGGLAKVIEGLAKALSESGVSVTVITPLYEDNQGKKHDSAQALIEKGFLTEGGERVAIQTDPVAEIGMTFGPMYDSGTHTTGLTDDKIRSFQRTVQSRVYETKADGVRYLFLRHPRLADKLYAKVPSSEELRRAVFLSRAALEVVQNRALGVDPQMIISNDWVTGLIPVLLQKDPRYAQDPLLENVGTIHMIHNYGRDYQGRIFTNQYGLDLWPMLGLDHTFYKDVADPNDDRFLNITSSAMDHINRSILTVSRPYAEQMLTPEAGEGLDNILNPLSGALFGISNGIDEAAARKTFWKKGEEARSALGLAPLLEEYNEEGFLANLWEYKNAALIKTQRDFGLTENPDALFLPMIGRVAEQKGIRLLTETEGGVTVLESLLKMDSRVQIFLGGPVAEGDSTAERLRDLTLELQERYPGRIHGEYTFIPGATTLQVMLAGRFFLMPSRYEPGGITQLESLAAGTPVVARNVGGIAATLINYFDDPVQGNGFLFTDFTGAALRGTLADAFEAVARDPGLLRILSDRAATAENDWHDRIPRYLSLLQLGAGVIRPLEDEFTTDYDYLSDRTAIFNDLRPRNRSELRAEDVNPYTLEENVTRGFAQLDEMHGGRIRTSLNSRIAAGNKPRVLLIGVGRGVVSADMLREYGDKIELYSTAKEDLLFSPEQLEAFWEGKVSGAETAAIISTLKDRYVISDAEKDLGAFNSLSFDVIVITQTVMQYIKNKPGLVDRLSAKLALQGELMTDFDVFSLKDSATGSSVDIKAFFESLGPDYEAYGITLGKTQAPISLLAGLRFTRSSNQINEIPLDATDNARIYHPRRSELRSEQVNAPQNVRLNGVSPEMLKVEAGELVFWRPAQRQMNTSLKRPYDDEQVVIQKIRNELETLDNLWMTVMGELQERSYSLDALDVVEIMVRRAMELIRAQEIKAEVALRTVKEEMLSEAKEESGDDLDLTMAAGIVDKRLLPALENREELVYVESGIDQEARKKLFIDRERDQILAKIFEIILRLPYGLHISPEDYEEDEKDRVKKLISTERQIANGRRIMLVNDSLPEILKLVEQGKRAQFAINQVIKTKIDAGMDRLKKMVEDNRKSGGDTLMGSRLIKIFEEQKSLLEGIRDEFDTYDFLYDFSDLPPERERKRRAELERFEAVYRDALIFFPEPSEALKVFLEEFKTQVTYEIRERGRTLDYGTAKFFSQKGSEQYKDLPDDQLDFLMRFYNVSQYGIVKRGGDRNLVVFAEKIRHEADFAELMMRNKGRGRVVSIATLKRFAPDDAPGRVPHWFIFSKDQGIVPIEALDFEDRKRDFSELKDGDFVLVDGKKGIAVVNASAETQRDMIERGKVYKYLDEYFLPRAQLPALVNERPFHFWADESRLDYLKREGDQPRFQKFGARGIGLLRLEQLMGEMDRAGIEFDEMRLSLAIEEMLLPFSDPEAPLTIRLYDVQGDKRPKFFVEGKSEEQLESILKTHSNIRFYLDENPEFRNQREFGKMQIKAIYRAYLRARKNNLQILLPNLLKVEEVGALKKLFDEARQELLSELQEEALVQTEAAVVRRHGWVSGIDALEIEGLEKGLDWFRAQLLGKPEMKPHEKTFGQEADADFAKAAGSDFREKITETLSKIRFGYMFEEVSAVEQRANIMKAVLEQHQNPEAKPFFGIGTNDLQKSVLESRDEGSGEMNKLHPALIKAIADLEGTSRDLGLHLTVEGQWGGSARMLFAAMALEIYHGRKMQLVAPTNKIPELLEMIRMTALEDLEHTFDLGPSYKPASMKTLIDRLEAGELPALDEMNLVATMLQDRIEAKIVASADFQTFRTLKERQELISRSELRDLDVETVSETAAFKKEVVRGVSDSVLIIGVSGFEESLPAVTAVSRELDGLYFGAELASALPAMLTVQFSGDEKTFDVPNVQAVRLWVAHQVGVENGLFESSEVTDPELRQMLSSIAGMPSQAPDEQGKAGFAASIHVQLESAPELTSLLPVLAVAISVNGAFHLNIDSMNEEEAGEFEKAIRELAASKTMKFKPGQIQVKGSLQAGVFATVPKPKFSERDKHALIGKEEAFRNVQKRKGQNLFSLDPAAVKNPGLFASTVITVLQAVALGKQPEEYFQVLDPRSLNPDHFADILQTVTTYLAAQARIQAAA